MFRFNNTKYNTRGLFSGGGGGGGLTHGRSFPTQKFVSKHPEAYFREGACTWKTFSVSKVCFLKLRGLFSGVGLIFRI